MPIGSNAKLASFPVSLLMSSKQTQGVSEMSEKCSGAKMRELIATVAGPVEYFDNRKAWLNKAAHNSGLTFRTVKALFYGEIKDPDHKAARKLKDAAIEAGRKEARSLAAQFETIAGGLNATDHDFHREDVAALLSAARTLRGLDRAGTKGR